MLLAYPVTLKTYANGQVGASFPDVPEAMTAGDSKPAAMEHAQDALAVALADYLDRGLPLPIPSPAKRGQRTVLLPPMVAIKLAIANAMLARKMTQNALAALIGCDDRAVRRVLDVHHQSTLAQLQAALTALGLQAGVSVTALAD